MKYHTIIAILIFSSILCTIIFQNANALEIELRNKKGELVYSEKNIAGYSFEIGPWAAPLVITNVILFSLVFLYHKKILPSIIRKLIMMIFKFEISRKVAFVCLAVLLIMYVGFSVNRLLQPPDQLPDYPLFLQLTKNWKGAISSDYAVNVRFVLSSISYYFLGNVRIVPFLESISLLLLSYYFTAQLSEKRFAGIISVVIILQSNLFWQYDTTPTEDNAWTLFYLLSLVLIAKRQQYLSPIAYVLSFFCKPLIAIFIPFTYYFIYRSENSKKEKIRISIFYAVVVILLLLGIMTLFTGAFTGPGVQERGLKIHIENFLPEFAILGDYLRSDGLVLLFLLPLVVGLFNATRKNVLHADSFMFLIFGILSSGPLLVTFTGTNDEPYRYVPLIIYFSIGVGLLLSNKFIDSSVPSKNRPLSTLVFLACIVIVLYSLFLAFFPGFYSGPVTKHYITDFGS